MFCVRCFSDKTQCYNFLQVKGWKWLDGQWFSIDLHHFSLWSVRLLGSTPWISVSIHRVLHKDQLSDNKSRACSDESFSTALDLLCKYFIPNWKHAQCAFTKDLFSHFVFFYDKQICQIWQIYMQLLRIITIKNFTGKVYLRWLPLGRIWRYYVTAINN